MEVGELPADLTCVPHQLVSMAGLDVGHNPQHKSIWDCFTLNRRPDRLPLVFQPVSSEKEFPKAKPKRASYDSYIPRGVLKTNWMRKHLQEIPAVVVLFMDLDWNHPSWTEKKTECQSKVESLRHGLEGRNTRLAVVLVQNASPLPPGEDVLAAERATELCTACDLSPKSLFVLPRTDHLFGYILRLEHAFHELAQAYYQAEIRRVKSKKEFLNKTTHQSLLVRCQFKLGFFSEFRQDSHTALRHYKLAFQHLTELSTPDTHWLEWKTVAGFLNYKICRLCFTLNTPLDAISQFRRHADFYRGRVGGPVEVAEFEHAAWLCRQFSVFGELFENAVHNGLAAIQTQHPGFYFQSAAQQAVARKNAVQKLWPSLSGVNYPTPDPLEFSSKIEFYGQRPWRIGLPEGQNSAEDWREESGYVALKLRELQKDLSGQILQLLNSAMSQFKRYKSPRMKRSIMVQMAEEYLLLGDYGKALQLFSHAIWEYRQERWWTLLRGILLQALQCAFCLGNVKEYVALCLELIGASLLGGDEKSRIQSNLMRLLGGNVPETEPNLPDHSVMNAVEIWRRELTERCFFLVEMRPLTGACVQARAWFTEDSFLADQLVKLKVATNLTCPFPVKFTKLSVALNPSTAEYDSHCVVEDSDPGNSSGNLYLVPGQVEVFEFALVPRPMDVGKELSIRSVSLDVGQLQSPIYGTLHWDGPGGLAPCVIPAEYAISLPHVGIFQRTFFRSSTKVDWRPAKVEIELNHTPPVLLSEEYGIVLKIRNKEKAQVKSAKWTGGLRQRSRHQLTGDQSLSLVEDETKPRNDLKLVISVDSDTEDEAVEKKQGILFRKAADEHGGDFSPRLILSLPDMGPDQLIEVPIFCSASTAGAWNVSMEVSYSVSCVLFGKKLDCECALTEHTVLPVVHPFSLNCRLLSLGKNENLDRFVMEETCLIMAEVKATSPFDVTIEKLDWHLASFLALQDETARDFSNVLLKKDECCAVLACVSPVSLSDGTISAGRLKVQWKRNGVDKVFETNLSLPCLSVDFCPVIVTAGLSAYGSVRQPITTRFELRNLTESVLELQALLDSAEAFMFSGHKQFSRWVRSSRQAKLAIKASHLRKGDKTGE